MAIARRMLLPHKVRRIEDRLARRQSPSRIAREEHVDRETVRTISRGLHPVQLLPRPCKQRCQCGALLLTDSCLACELNGEPQA